MYKTTIEYCGRDVGVSFNHRDYNAGDKSNIDYNVLHKMGTALTIVEDNKGASTRSLVQSDLPINLAIKVKSSIYKKYVINLTIRKISAGLSISLLEFIQFAVDRICRKYVHETTMVVDDCTWQIMVIDGISERRSDYSALFTVNGGKAHTRFDDLAKNEIRSITFVDGNKFDNTIVANAVRIPDRYIGYGLQPIQKLYEAAIAALKVPEKYGIYGYKPNESNVDGQVKTETLQSQATITLAQPNKKHVVGFEYEIVYDSKQQPTIKFNRKVDLSTLRFTFAGERGTKVNVIADDSVLDLNDYLVYYVNGTIVIEIVIQAPYGSVSFYTYDRIINTDLIGITLK